MQMSIYREICKEIDILETRIEDLETEYYFLYRSCFRSGSTIIPLDIATKRMKEICDQIEVYVAILEEKEQAKAEIEKHLSELDRLDRKVAYLRDVEGWTLPEIASHLGYSLVWIKKISARTRKEYTKSIPRH